MLWAVVSLFNTIPPALYLSRIPLYFSGFGAGWRDWNIYYVFHLEIHTPAPLFTRWYYIYLFHGMIISSVCLRSFARKKLVSWCHSCSWALGQRTLWNIMEGGICWGEEQAICGKWSMPKEVKRSCCFSRHWMQWSGFEPQSLLTSFVTLDWLFNYFGLQFLICKRGYYLFFLILTF